jgi:uncharacterized membrane protein
MNRNTRLLAAGAGAAAGFYAVKALWGKQINTLPYGYGIKLKRAVTINCPPGQLYDFWSNLTNLSKLCDNVLSVEVLDARRSSWTLKAPGGFTLEWDAEITVDRPNEMIGWRSLQEADLDNAGYVRFEPAPGGPRHGCTRGPAVQPTCGKTRGSACDHVWRKTGGTSR